MICGSTNYGLVPGLSTFLGDSWGTVTIFLPNASALFYLNQHPSSEHFSIAAYKHLRKENEKLPMSTTALFSLPK